MKANPERTAIFEPYLRTPIQSDGELIPQLRLVPFSAHSAKLRIIGRLIELGWRFHHSTAEWFDLSDLDNIRGGRLCYKPDFSEAWIRPPGRRPAGGGPATLPESIPIPLNGAP